LIGNDQVAAVWAACYPGIMVEWLSGALAISRVRPTGPGRSVNEVDFLYPTGLAESNPEWIKAHQDAYWETAMEDDRIAEAIQAGRNALAISGRDESGPAHPHLEAGIIRFHDWLESKAWRGWSKQSHRKIAP
jgi:phenylpropionate dioxygenase-like ring-hydroxylating dioxygenase large terminal subunit